jgi:hypothetical protein
MSLIFAVGGQEAKELPKTKWKQYWWTPCRSYLFRIKDMFLEHLISGT